MSEQLAFAPRHAAPAFQTERLGFRYPSARADAVQELSIEVPHGAFYAIIGPNGSGKSTLLKLLLGTEQPNIGRALFDGQDVRDWNRGELARRVGVVTQTEDTAFPFSVRETVAMGRYPHLGLWRAEGTYDRAAIDAALETCDITSLAQRGLATLSAGERQRARIARALAQEPDALVLDEPTAALDIRHEMQIFEILRGLSRSQQVTVILVTHNINLAARYATQLLLLDRGSLAAQGAPAQVIEQTVIERVYGWTVTVAPHPGPGEDAGLPQVTPLALHANRSPTSIG